MTRTGVLQSSDGATIAVLIKGQGYVFRRADAIVTFTAADLRDGALDLVAVPVEEGGQA